MAIEYINQVQLNEFLEQSEQRAFQIALYASKSQEDALDIVQEAMMTLAQQYAHKSSSEWGPLFHRILQSKIHDWYRRQNVRLKWRQLLPFSNKEITTEANSGSNSATNRYDPIENSPELKNTKPDDKLMQARTMEALNSAVQNLPLRQQQAFLLRCIEGLNVAETASAMNCSQGSVKTHYSRAIHSLREKLEDHI